MPTYEDYLLEQKNFNISQATPMELRKITIESLRGFINHQVIEIAPAKLTALIGPNGTGKTTLLDVLACALEVLKTRKLRANYPPGVPATTAKSVWLRFYRTSSEEPFSGVLAKLLDPEPEYVEIHVEVTAGAVELHAVRTPRQDIQLTETTAALGGLDDELKTARQTLAAEEASLARLQKNTPGTPAQRAQRHANINTQKKKIEVARRAVTDLEARSTTQKVPRLVWTPAKENPEETEFSCLGTFIDHLTPNDYNYFRFGDRIPDTTNVLLDRAIASKQGRDDTFHRETTERLSALLESPTFAYKSGNQDVLRIGGTEPQSLSSGSSVCLRHFALVQATPKPQLILWDEPENGLHATRRHKMLASMLLDPHMYIIATHATEFVSLTNTSCRAYRTSGSFNDSVDSTELQVELIDSRRSAFRAAEALGIDPASTLFTASTVIWVEGPSDLIFWHWAISSHATGRTLMPGFDFTILMYGGSNVASLSLECDGPALDLTDLFAITRRALVIVDSDYESEEDARQGALGLKSTALALHAAAERARAARPNSAKVLWTPGRELENHYPDVVVREIVTSTQEPEAGPAVTQLAIGQFVRYHAEIERAVRSDGRFRQYREKQVPMGSTTWGPSGKVEFAKKAIQSDKMKLADLKWGMSALVDEVVSWLKNSGDGRRG